MGTTLASKSPATVHAKGRLRSHATESVDDALATFLRARPRLFGAAYRILGSAADADDVVQSVWLKWQMTERTVVRDPPAFLTTAAVRLAVKVAQSARARRESYVGPWLPEPVGTGDDPYLGAERGDALELAVLVLLEKLAPNERAAYVLREAFDYPFGQIAEILRLSEANVRQLLSRARKHIASERRAPASAAAQKRLLSAFISAAAEGDAVGLEGLFAADVVSYADGGGILNAARVPVRGRKLVAKYVAKVASPFWTGVELTVIDANGRAGLLMVRGGEVVAFATVVVSRRRIEQILWVMRPSKLAAIARTPRVPGK